MSERFTVSILPEDKKVPAEKGENLLDVLLKSSVQIDTACGSQGICRKCKVRITGKNGEPETKLACQTEITGDMEVLIPEVDVKSIQVVNDDFLEVDGGLDSEMAVAFDIGTTTLKAEVFTIPEGRTIARISSLNPQRVFGHDVMSRIQAASNPNNAATMTGMIRKSIEGMCKRLLKRTGISYEQISRIVIAGNTVMLHLFFGMDITGMGKYPYTPVSLSATVEDASPFGFDEFIKTEIIGLPAISSYLGGDLVAGILTTGIHEKRETSLLIDIGTNAEIILSYNGSLIATSCAAGPALEGMNIQCGMTAGPGAIEEVEIGHEIRLNIIPGYRQPLGLCGSGIIDLIAELIRVGLIDSKGRMLSSDGHVSQEIQSRVRKYKGTHAFYLTEDILFTQKDVRQVQLAKGAILSGFRALKEYSGMSPEDVRSVYIAGEFGRNLKLDHIKRLGFLDDMPNAEYNFLGNSSIAGAKMIGSNPSLLQKAEKIAGKVAAFPLSSFEGYQRLFVQSLEFPGNPEMGGENAKNQN